jgi:hypothetical protein
MKKVISLIGLLFIEFNSSSQITTFSNPEKSEIKKTATYDSLSNFLGDNVYLYFGQELYLNKMSESLRKFNYSGFFLDYQKSTSSLKNTYKAVIPENKEYIEYDIGGGRSYYDSIAGKYFKVLQIYQHPEAKKMEFLYGKTFYLKLQEKESGDILYYEYDSRFEHSFPFIVVGLFEKLRKTYIGQQFVFANNIIGSEKIVTTGEKWKCIDLAIEDQYYRLSLIFQNSIGRKLPIEYELILDKSSSNYFSEQRADYYKGKFGFKNWYLILQGKAVLGMTREMCRLAWGDPEKINETITKRINSEQWVYSSGYLYFTNGILTAIQ